MQKVGKICLKTEEEISCLYSRVGGWLFRGHASSKWHLTSSLERICKAYSVKPSCMAQLERNALFEFQRKAHHYIQDPPAYNDYLEWTALLQHYGGTTRLVDVTHSIFVAAFFAIENATDEAAIWAFNAGKITAHPGLEGPLHPDSGGIKEANTILCGVEQDSGIRLVKPFRLNQRLASQQGAFLMPLSLETSFEEQMANQLEVNINDYENITITTTLVYPAVKIVIPKNIQSRLLRLLSAANISATTLFGGLDGFARSLKTAFRMYDL